MLIYAILVPFLSYVLQMLRDKIFDLLCIFSYIDWSPEGALV